MSSTQELSDIEEFIMACHIEDDNTSRANSIAKRLINKGIDVNGKDKDDTTLLMHACEYSRSRAIPLMLLDYKADVNAVNNKGETALICACNKNSEDKDVRYRIVRDLICYGAKVNVADNNGWTPFLQACEDDDDDLASLLVSKGANVKARTKDGHTALMFAAEHANIEFMEYLLQEGIDINAETKDGWTALMYACKYSHVHYDYYNDCEDDDMEDDDMEDDDMEDDDSATGNEKKYSTIEFLLCNGANITQKIIDAAMNKEFDNNNFGYYEPDDDNGPSRHILNIIEARRVVDSIESQYADNNEEMSCNTPSKKHNVNVSEINAIIVNSPIKYRICQVVLANNKINKKSLEDLVDNYKYVEVSISEVSYDTLVSIMKPYGLQVINEEKLNTILNLPDNKIENAIYDSEYEYMDCKTDYSYEEYNLLRNNVDCLNDDNIRSLTLCYAPGFKIFGENGPFYITNEEKLKTMDRDALLKNCKKIIGEIYMELAFDCHVINPI
jgi:ankyrin repeat protein